MEKGERKRAFHIGVGKEKRKETNGTIAKNERGKKRKKMRGGEEEEAISCKCMSISHHMCKAIKEKLHQSEASWGL